MNIIEELFSSLTEIVAGFVEIMQAIFADTGIIAIFWDGTTGLTVVGGLLLLGFGYGIVRFAFGWVVRLVKMRF